MNDAQIHRGPDGSGIHLEPGVGLAHRRLSIIDVATGQQPLFNEDGTVVVVFNGEIYNFQELVSELQALGHVFRTRSDTEVIVHAWESWGEKCLDRFRGMFAFALFDRSQDALFLARDRLGVKPLHYAFLPDGTLAFGSELKSLLTLATLPRQIDVRAVEDFFALGYVPDPKTIFSAVRKLPPANCLIVRRGTTVPLPHPYWDVHFSLDRVLSIDEACFELRQRLAESVRLRLMSEVPLGAFLSGGVDSSAVVATMARVSDVPVTTCSIAFRESSFDESYFAQKVALRYKTRHFIDHVGSDDFELLDRLARMYDEPYADSSALPTYRVCELAREHVTVALSGDGGDETFGGYRRYKLHLIEERLRSVAPLAVRKRVFGLLGRVYPKADWAPRVLRAKTTLESLSRGAVEAYEHTMSIFSAKDRAKLFSRSFRQELGGYSAGEVFRYHAARAETSDPLALIQYIDLKTYLAGDINTKVDRASMAHSLEVREPLMDHSLVEWMATLPSNIKIRRGEGKYLLKRAMEPLLPHEVMYRPKMGFSIPIAAWLRGPLYKRLRSRVLEGRLVETGFFEPTALEALVAEHTSKLRDHSAVLWALLMFEAFLRIVVENEEMRASDAHGIRS